MPDNHQHWPRFIAFIDINAFFASTEQLDNPEYRGKPIGVTNGKANTCIITGHGFGVRREDIRKLLLSTGIKVFTLQNMTRFVQRTRLAAYCSR